MSNQYTVVTGDTVDAIAKRFGVKREDVRGYRSADPNTIFPGEVLDIGKPTPLPSTVPPTTNPATALSPIPAASPSPTPNQGIDPLTGLPLANPNLSGDAPSPAPAPAPVASGVSTTPILATPPSAPSVPTNPQNTPQKTFTTPSGLKLNAQGQAIDSGDSSIESLIAELELSDPELAAKYKDVLEPKRNILSKYGISADSVEQGFQSNPFFTISDLVRQVMQATGLPDVKENITNISKEIEVLANQRDDEIEKINDNPWTSSSTKSERIKQIEDKYENKIANRTNRLTLVQSAYQQARQEAQFAATTAIGLYDKQRTFDFNFLKETLDTQEKAAAAKAKLAEQDLQFVSGTDNQRSGFFDKKTGEFTPIGGGGGVGGTKAPTVTKINGVDMQWNPLTGKWESPSGISGVGGKDASPYQTERAFRTLQSVDELGIQARSNPGIFGRSAAFPLPDFARSDAFRNFKAQLETLKSSITFGELTAMREASKTGGALGQVSDVENRLLSASLGALSMSQTPEGFNQQLTKIKQSIQRWQAAVNQYGLPPEQPSITAPDGTQVIITD